MPCIVRLFVNLHCDSGEKNWQKKAALDGAKSGFTNKALVIGHWSCVMGREEREKRKSEADEQTTNKREKHPEGVGVVSQCRHVAQSTYLSSAE